MNFEFTKSVIDFFNKWNNINIFILILSITNIILITCRWLYKKEFYKNKFKNIDIKQLISGLSIMTIIIIIMVVPTLSKYFVFITLFYYFYYIYIVPIFDIKDNAYILDLPEILLIIIAGLYYYFSVIFSYSSLQISFTNSGIQIIYIILLLITLFSSTYCLLLNVYYILNFAIKHLSNKISNLNINRENKNIDLCNFEKEENMFIKILKISLYYLLTVSTYFIYILVFIFLSPYYAIRKIKDIQLKTILSIIAKISIIVSLITMHIIMQIDGNYNSGIISIYELLISVIIIPLILEAILKKSKKLNNKEI